MSGRNLENDGARLADLIALARLIETDPDPSAKYRVVLYKADGMFWTRRGEADGNELVEAVKRT